MRALIQQVTALVNEHSDEHELTARVSDVLSASLADGLEVPPGATRPDPLRYVMYPLYVAPDGAFSIAAAVWNVGQGTPVHGHETWGVVGIYSGREREKSFEKPAVADVPLVSRGEYVWGPGQVTVCCTTDDDVHQVRCEGDEPVVGIHIYGADIGVLPRRSYDPDTGAVHWFVSEWADFQDPEPGSDLEA